MKASVIFEKACGYLSQKVVESEEIKAFTPNWLDTLVVEALPYENAVREFYGKTKLVAAPRVLNMETEIPYTDEICRVALPYGLASLFFADDDNQYSAQDFRGRFIIALNDVVPIKKESVRDSYA